MGSLSVSIGPATSLTNASVPAMPAPRGCASRRTRASVCGSDASNFAASTPVRSAVAEANGASANGVAVACSDNCASRSVPAPVMPICAAVPVQSRRRLRAGEHAVAGDRCRASDRERFLRTDGQIAGQPAEIRYEAQLPDPMNVLVACVSEFKSRNATGPRARLPRELGDGESTDVDGEGQREIGRRRGRRLSRA